MKEIPLYFLNGIILQFLNQHFVQTNTASQAQPCITRWLYQAQMLHHYQLTSIHF